MAETHTDREKVAIAEVLDTYRDVVRWKVDGLSRDEAVKCIVASETSLLGVVKHLVYVERYWFQAVLAGDESALPPWRTDPGFDWRIEANESIDDIVELYADECARSREVFDGLESLDAEFPRRDEMLTARNILLHLIEEIARHVGHMDIIRELIDESTGWGPED
jgi:uncharacterized damage-inducible protein DinB